MRLKPGTLIELSKRTDIDTVRLSAYAATRLRPSRKRAIHLENTTGIPAPLWMFGTSKDIKQAIISLS